MMTRIQQEESQQPPVGANVIGRRQPYDAACQAYLPAKWKPKHMVYIIQVIPGTIADSAAFLFL